MMNMMPAGESMANAAALHDEDDYIRIGDMAKQFGVTLRTLRFYEDKGLLNPKREGNTRLYTRRDVTRLKLILLGRKVGFSLREVKQIMDLYDPESSNVKQLRTLLDKSERQLVRLEWLVEVVIGPLIQRHRPFARRPDLRQQDHWRPVVGLTQAAQRLAAVQSRHQHVEDDEMRTVPLHLAQRSLTVAGYCHAEPAPRQESRQLVRYGCLVIDQQNAAPAHSAPISAEGVATKSRLFMRPA